MGLTKAGFHGSPINNLFKNFPIKIMKGKRKRKKVAKSPVCFTAYQAYMQPQRIFINLSLLTNSGIFPQIRVHSPTSEAAKHLNTTEGHRQSSVLCLQGIWRYVHLPMRAIKGKNIGLHVLHFLEHGGVIRRQSLLSHVSA